MPFTNKYTWRYKVDHITYRLDVPMCRLLGVSYEGRKVIKFRRKPVGDYMWYRDIMAEADRLGVAPEMLVDEPYYFFKSLIAPYRLAFRLGRKYENLTDFYDYLGREYKFVPGMMNFYHLLKGTLGMIRNMRFWVVERTCQQAELPMAYLFSPYRRLGREASFGTIHNLVAALKDYDAAALAGFAKMLVQGDVDHRELDRLLEWREARRAECAG